MSETTTERGGLNGEKLNNFVGFQLHFGLSIIFTEPLKIKQPEDCEMEISQIGIKLYIKAIRVR